MSLTPRQIANRANAQKSTGPKTAEGKARSSLNAVKHGLAAQQLVLPNEDSEAYKAVVQVWIEALQPADTAEMALVERAAMADWRLKRCIRAEHASLSARVRHAVEIHDRARLERAEELGNRLLYDPLNRCMVPPSDPETLRKLLIWRAINPATVVRELESFAEGVDWMIARWQRIAVILDRELRRALADLQKKRKEEAQAAKRVEKEIACETEAVEEKPVRKRTTTRRTAPPNEAKEPRSEMSTRAARGRKTVVRCEESSPGKFDGSRPIKEHAGNQGP